VRTQTFAAENALTDLPDRLVVAGGHGRLALSAPRMFTAEGEVVRAGQSLGRVDDGTRTHDVCAPCDAWVVEYLVRDGQRVEPGSPVVHLRAL
jgi:biotin carboxyl carrier protein